jgi:hypothetical protein
LRATDRPDGLRVIVLVSYLLGSAILVAFTVTVVWEAIVAGAVYRPLAERVPVLGDKLQVTPVFEVPVTVDMNCCVCPAVNVGFAGLTVTMTPAGLTVIVAVANSVGSETLVMVTVTVVTVFTTAGAVYRPLAEMLPKLGDKL